MRTYSLLVTAVALAGACKGATPTKPSGVTFAYVAPNVGSSDQCSGNAAYIGDVALDPQGINGYAAILPYLPSSCNSGGGNGPIGPLYIEGFLLDGTTPNGMAMMPIGNAQTATNEDYVPRVAATNSGPVWITGQMQGGDLLYGPPVTDIMFDTQSGGLDPVAIMDVDPLGVVVIAGSAQNSPNGISDIDSPDFPSGGNSAFREPVLASIGPVPAGSGSGNITVTTGASINEVQSLQKNRVVSDGTNFYYLSIDSSDSSSYDIMEVQLGATQVTKLATIGSHFPNPLPVGLALAGNDLAVTLAPNVFANNQSGAGCALWHYDVATMQASESFETTNFTCLDAALDGEVYFVIADTQNTCTGCSASFRGIGVGRVAFGSSEPNTLLLDIDASAPGPRRVYLDLTNSTMYLVDPFEIAGISEQALDGVEDVKP
jgi:hypothetical protein